MIDNHIIANAEKERDKGDRCSCGGSWEEIAWCGELNQECDPYTEADCREAAINCRKETRLECQKCGAVCEAE